MGQYLFASKSVCVYVCMNGATKMSAEASKIDSIHTKKLCKTAHG